MSYTINTQYLVSGCCYDTKPNVQYIVIHYTGAPGGKIDTALDNAVYFYREQWSDLQGSAHYFVDDKYIYASVPENKSAWHCGDGKGLYNITNLNSLGIEMCCTAGNYDMTPATENLCAQFAADLLKKYHLGMDRLVRHYDASRKLCPKSMSGPNNARWNNFRAKVQSYMNGGSNGGGTVATEVFRVFDVNNKQCSAWKSKDSAINAAKSIKGYVKSSTTNQIIADYRTTASDEVFRVFDANNVQKASFKNKDSALKQAQSIKGYVKSSKTNQIVADYRNSAAPTTGYRVKDAKGTQLGYFNSLANAKALCDKNPGSKVYDGNGNVVYSKPASTDLYVNLHPVRSSWNVYPVGVTPVYGNQCGSLNPKAYGGLSYKVLKNLGNDVYEIQTQNYGRVTIYCPTDNEGCASTTKMY